MLSFYVQYSASALLFSGEHRLQMIQRSVLLEAPEEAPEHRNEEKVTQDYKEFELSRTTKADVEQGVEKVAQKTHVVGEIS